MSSENFGGLDFEMCFKSFAVIGRKHNAPPTPFWEKEAGFGRSVKTSVLFSSGEAETPHTQSSLSVLLGTAGFEGS